MSKIYIRGRKEPLEVPNHKALTIKNKKYGMNGVEAADPTEWVDLDNWIGEFGDIKSIDMEVERSSAPAYDYKKEILEQENAFLKTPPHLKAKQLGWFKLAWFCKSGMKEMSPPPEVLAKAEELGLKYYEENPQCRRIEKSIYAPLLFARFGMGGTKDPLKTISEKMSVPEPVKVDDIPF